MNHKSYCADGKKPYTEQSKDASKKISKVDEDAKRLIINILGDNLTRGFDIDSLYYTKSGWKVIEFLKCETASPHASHPRRYWKKAFRKVMSMWALTQKLEGRFIWITYEVPYNRFSIIEFLEITTEDGIIRDKRIDTDYDGFKKWFNGLNDSAEPLW